MRFICALLVSGVTLNAFADCPEVRLELKLKPAASGLDVEATLKNTGKQPIELMTTGDGSSSGRRNPTLTFTLEPNLTNPIGICGFMNPLTDEDFLTLKPDARHILRWVHPPTPAKPGNYTLQVTYKNDPAAAPVDRGSPKSPTKEQLARITKTVACQVTSAPLHFTWDGKRAKSLEANHQRGQHSAGSGSRAGSRDKTLPTNANGT